MSIVAKQKLLKAVECKLSSILVVDDLTEVVNLLTVELGMYEVEEKPENQADVETADFLEAFLSAKLLEGRSDATIKHYRYVITRFLQDANTPIRDITIYHLRGYLNKQKLAGIADKTLEGNRSVFCSFFGWLADEGLLKSNPCNNLHPIKCAKKVKLPYTDVDIEKLKEACGCNRDKAIVAFLLSTGCRIGEVCKLNRDSINFQSGECTVHGKGNKERTVFLDDVTMMLLKRYLEERHDESNALFVGKGTTRMTPGGIRARLHTIADGASVEHVHPHRFRRTLATNLINHGMQIQEVASILGHDKLDTTMKYVCIDKNNVKNAYRKYI